MSYWRRRYSGMIVNMEVKPGIRARRAVRAWKREAARRLSLALRADRDALRLALLESHPGQYDTILAFIQTGLL